MKTLGEFLGRAPFVFLGVISLFSIASTFLELQEGIAESLDAWKAVTRPFWDFLLSRALGYFDLSLPWWTKDYLTLCVIISGMLIRARYPSRLVAIILFAPILMIIEILDFDDQPFLSYLGVTIFVCFFLPLAVLVSPMSIILDRPKFPSEFNPDNQLEILKARYPRDIDKIRMTRLEVSLSEHKYQKESALLFYEMAIYFLILIAINYALIEFFAQPSRPAEIGIWV